MMFNFLRKRIFEVLRKMLRQSETNRQNSKNAENVRKLSQMYIDSNPFGWSVDFDEHVFMLLADCWVCVCALQVIKDYQLFVVIVFFLFVDILLLISWELLDPMKIKRTQFATVVSLSLLYYKLIVVTTSVITFCSLITYIINFVNFAMDR